MKKSKITIENKVKKLSEQGWNFIKINKNKYQQISKSSGGYGPSFYTERQICNLYNCIFEKGKIGNKDAKKFTKGKDRGATRDNIKTEKFDDIPNNKRVKESDIWNWD